MDPFVALGVEPKFDLDIKEVEKRHRDLSRALHPDKFASSGATERKISLTQAADVNEAWRIVRDPIRRAEALFERSGIAIGETNEPMPSQEFLMEMLEQRESLEEAKLAHEANAARDLGSLIEERAKKAEEALAQGFANASKEENAIGSLTVLLQTLGELRFYRRFLDEVTAIEDAIEGT
jgi:molecular chaperone HscB